MWDYPEKSCKVTNATKTGIVSSQALIGNFLAVK